ncbi:MULTISPECIES: DUF7144 family membrane protein [Streptomyces]|uniref:DUF7144 domain-containing protein n=1 Tax=Streptomyces chengmaiensis TaxID=3040919 RepID=A0ABT6HJJ1_9ACTN|nr:MULTISPECIES: hypothetical protein [Streptomyces]MDH2388868.1 hypothetical protein [Streptomyces chengmaiensis]WRQ78167.1 hypothetical protein I3F59_001515 [Streptomyces sp. MUM 178J]
MATTTRHRSEEATAAARGLVAFAAVMLFIGGLLDLFRGIMAIGNDDIYVATPDYVFQFDLTGWGWFQLILGAVAILVSLGLFAGSVAARVAAVGLAGILIIVNFLTIPYYPFWSIVLIAVYGFIIWALCVYKPEES